MYCSKFIIVIGFPFINYRMFRFSKKRLKIFIAYANWAEGIAMTNLAKVSWLEEKGYVVSSKNADIAPIFASLSRESGYDLWMHGCGYSCTDYMKQIRRQAGYWVNHLIMRK